MPGISGYEPREVLTGPDDPDGDNAGPTVRQRARQYTADLVLLPIAGGLNGGRLIGGGRGAAGFRGRWFGINGVFSVIGTMVVLPGAILLGFPSMALGAGGVYVLAAAVGIPLALRAPK